jgi:hypothetical protein
MAKDNRHFALRHAASTRMMARAGIDSRPTNNSIPQNLKYAENRTEACDNAYSRTEADKMFRDEVQAELSGGYMKAQKDNEPL